MKPNYIENIKKLEEQKPDELLLKHDMKLLELEQRLNSLENLLNVIHNQYPVWWAEKNHTN